MTSKGNRFGIGPVDMDGPAPRRIRDVGPMGAAVRDAANNLQVSSDALVEQRRQNAADAAAFRLAQEEGRMVVALALDAVHTEDLPRDRMDLAGVAASDEMEELKASIRARGQREPIEVFRDGQGRLQLKAGWRRLSALRQLLAETGDGRYSTVLARVSAPAADRLDLYIDMVEENVIREDLSFAEMAQVAIEASRDPASDIDDADVLVGRLYASLHKMKRSYIRTFVFLLQTLGEDLRFPQAVSRNLGVEVARKLKDRAADAGALRRQLSAVGDAEVQAQVLARFCSAEAGPVVPAVKPAREKFEFHCGSAKVTARTGECRIKAKVDFASLDRAVLERAVMAFSRIVEEG